MSSSVQPQVQMPPEPLPVPMIGDLSPLLSSPEEQSFVVISNISDEFPDTSILLESQQMIEEALNQCKSAEEQANVPQPAVERPTFDECNGHVSEENFLSNSSNGLSSQNLQIQNPQFADDDQGAISIATFAPSDFHSEEIQKKVSQLIEENTHLRDTVIQNNKNMKAQYEKVKTWQKDAERVQEAHKQKFLEAKEMIAALKKEVAALKQENLRLQDVINSKITPTPENNIKEFELDVANRKIQELEDAIQKLTLAPLENEELVNLKETVKQLEAKNKDGMLKLQTERELRAAAEEKFCQLERDLRQLNANKGAELAFDTARWKGMEEKLARYEEQLESAYKENAELKKKGGVDMAATQELRITREKLLLSEMSNDLAEKELQAMQTQVARAIEKADLATKLQTDLDNAHAERERMLAELDARNLRIIESDARIRQLEEQLAQTNCSSAVDVQGMRDREEQAKVEAWMAKQKLAELEKQLQGTPATQQDLTELVYVRQQLMQAQMALMQADHARAVAEATATTVNGENAQLRKQLEAKENDDGAFALRAQLDVYKADFEAEQAAKEDVKREKNKIAEDLQHLHRRNQQMQEEIEHLRRQLSRNGAVPRPFSAGDADASVPGRGPTPRFTCPKCQFKFSDLREAEDHAWRCLDVEESLP